MTWEDVFVAEGPREAFHGDLIQLHAKTRSFDEDSIAFDCAITNVAYTKVPAVQNTDNSILKLIDAYFEYKNIKSSGLWVRLDQNCSCTHAIIAIKITHEDNVCFLKHTVALKPVATLRQSNNNILIEVESGQYQIDKVFLDTHPVFLDVQDNVISIPDNNLITEISTLHVNLSSGDDCKVFLQFSGLRANQPKPKENFAMHSKLLDAQILPSKKEQNILPILLTSNAPQDMLLNVRPEIKGHHLLSVPCVVLNEGRDLRLRANQSLLFDIKLSDPDAPYVTVVEETDSNIVLARYTHSLVPSLK